MTLENSSNKQINKYIKVISALKKYRLVIFRCVELSKITFKATFENICKTDSVIIILKVLGITV